MIDKIEDSLLSNVDNYEDKNNELGNRVKQYTLVNKYFDNFLRFNKQLIIRDIIIYTLIFSILLTIKISYFNLPKGTTTINILIDSWESWLEVVKYLGNLFLNSWGDRINIFLEQMEVSQYLSFYPIQKIEIISHIPTYFFNMIYFFEFLLFIYFCVVIYQYYTQKQLFNSTLLYMYIPKIFLIDFYYRDDLGYIYVRLLRHQKNKNIFSTQSKTIISNLFDIDLDSLNSKDKIELDLKPMKLFFLWDYYRLSYRINEVSSIKEDTNKKLKKPTKKDIKNNDIEDRVSEVIEKVEDSNNSELELLELEKLENIQL